MKETQTQEILEQNPEENLVVLHVSEEDAGMRLDKYVCKAWNCPASAQPICWMKAALP